MSRLTEAQFYPACMERLESQPEPEGQKFPVGTHVRITDDLGRGMKHFPSGCNATVEYTYAHAFDGDNVNAYSLNVDNYGSLAWYFESQLTEITDE